MILLEELRKIQEKHGYLKESELMELSARLSIPLSKIYSTASFYSFFCTEKKGTHIIRVCNNLSCVANGYGKVVECLEEVLGIKPGETTKDGMFTLETTSCIGCCDRPPAMLIDGKAYTNLDREKIKSIISGLSKV